MADLQKGPWNHTWRVVKPIGGGGQGHTYLVENQSSNVQAVMKTLRCPDDQQARRRMFQEVNNLKVLASAGVKIPTILDANVDKFSTVETLFFVMDYIEGESLAETLRLVGKLGLESAIDVAIDLATTMHAAHDQSVLHRDLKPENIIMRSISPSDAVIVDFGLSFNSRDFANITRVDETFDNDFLSLPERRVIGGDRRDPRSDLVGVCGILYFCISGEPPIDLVDEQGRFPHRRPGRALREHVRDDGRLWCLEALLDRGFSTHLGARFQTAPELIERLKEVRLSLSEPVKAPSAADFAKLSGQALMNEHRATQLAAFARNSGSLFGGMRDAANRIAQTIKPYSLGFGGKPQGIRTPPGSEPVPVENQHMLGAQHCLSISLPVRSDIEVSISYFLGAESNECTLYRRIDTRQSDASRPNVGNWQEFDAWHPVFRFDGRINPDPAVAAQDVESAIVASMQYIHNRVLEK